MAKRLTELEKILSQLYINESELAKRMGVSLAWFRQTRRNVTLKVSEDHLNTAREYVKEVAQKVSGAPKRKATPKKRAEKKSD